jgi:hypothetical protein
MDDEGDRAIQSWPRNRDREAGRQSNAPRFEKDHAIPARLRSVGVSLHSPFASFDLEDADGVRHSFRIPADDALWLGRDLSAGQFHSRILVHLRRSEGIPSPEGSPKDGQVPVPDAKAKAQSSGLECDSSASSSK